MRCPHMHIDNLQFSAARAHDAQQQQQQQITATVATLACDA